MSDRELRLVRALESCLVLAFETPCDDPSLEHSYWRPLLDLIAECRGESASDTLDRLRKELDSA